MAFTEAKRKPLTEEADGSGAEFGQEGNFALSCLKKKEIRYAAASSGKIAGQGSAKTSSFIFAWLAGLWIAVQLTANLGKHEQRERAG